VHTCKQFHTQHQHNIQILLKSQQVFNLNLVAEVGLEALKNCESKDPAAECMARTGM
jgi:hypothetical protein